MSDVRRARRLWETIRDRPASPSTGHACSARELIWLQAGGARLIFKASVRQLHAPGPITGVVRGGAPMSLVIRQATRYLLVPVDERELVFDVHVTHKPMAPQFLSA